MSDEAARPPGCRPVRRTMAYAAIAVSGVAVLAGGAAVILATPIESGQGTTLGGFAVLAGAALTFYSAHLNRRATSQEDLRAHHREVERDLRSHFTTGAEQLANHSATVRIAGVYLLASLADDWYQQGNESERQICIDVLCAYLRGDTMNENAVSSHFPVEAPYRQVEHATENEGRVRQAIVAAIRARTTYLPTRLNSPTWIGCDFDLSGAKLPKASLAVTDLTSALLVGAQLGEADLKGCRLSHANLTDACLEDAWLNGAILIGAGLPGAMLDGAHLDGAHLRNAILTGAYLQAATCGGTDFRGAKLIKAHLTGAELERADLRGARLEGAVLERANLSKVELNGADFRGANLTGAKVTTDEPLAKLRFDDNTIWPDGTNRPPGWVHERGEPVIEIEFDAQEIQPALGLQQVGVEFHEFPESTEDIIAWDKEQRVVALWPGVKLGSVYLRVEKYRDEPPCEGAGWDSVQAISVHFDSGDVRFRIHERSLAKRLPDLSIGSGPGGYRVRLYESGHDAGVEVQESGAVLSEKYLMQLWPESESNPPSGRHRFDVRE